jgi:hypothetical protein
MKKIIIIVTAFLILTGTGYAGQLNIEGSADGLTVRISVENKPLKVGENAMAIVLLDEDGGNISDAEVSVYYFMPVMPAMNYEAIATPEDDNYTAIIKPTMPGEWEAVINVKKGEGEAQKVTINFKAK